MTGAARTLCIGTIAFANGGKRGRGGEPLVLVDLPPCPFETAPNTVKLPLADEVEGRCRVLDASGAVRDAGRVRLRDLFTHLRPGPALQGRLEAESPVPLFVARADGPRSLHLYSQLRFSPVDALFVRTSAEPVAAGLEDVPAWFERAAELHQDSALFLNNHQCYYRKCLPGQELEVKFTFDEPVDIWGLTAEVYAAIEAGQLPGYVTEYRDEFQAWDYPTRLFEVVAPEEARGYVAFIPTTDGRYVVKRKVFAADALLRGETISDPVRIEGSLGDYLRRTLDGLELRRLPALRRVRYDVNFESLRSGHVYGIFFDRVSVIGREALRMWQCEVEYRRSRVALEPDEAAVFSEFEEVLAWVRRFLGERRLRSTEGYYSKLSFLRDCVERGLVEADPAEGVLV